MFYPSLYIWLPESLQHDREARREKNVDYSRVLESELLHLLQYSKEEYNIKYL